MQSGKVRIETREGSSHLAQANEFEAVLASSFITAIPAQAGTFLMTPVTTDDGLIWDRDDVVAWGVRANGSLLPLAADGPDDMNRAVLLPSGKVMAPFGTWDSADDYLRSSDAQSRG
jgi:hypothetical protein